MTLKDLRGLAASNILALHSTRSRESTTETLARTLERSARTLRRWESQQQPDRTLEYAYRYLAGLIFGWPAARYDLRRRQLLLQTSAMSHQAIPQRQVEDCQWNAEFQRRIAAERERHIAELSEQLALLPLLPADQPTPAGSPWPCVHTTTAGTTTTVPSVFATRPASNDSRSDAATSTAATSPPAFSPSVDA